MRCQSLKVTCHGGAGADLNKAAPFHQVRPVGLAVPQGVEERSQLSQGPVTFVGQSVVDSSPHAAILCQSQHTKAVQMPRNRRLGQVKDIYELTDAEGTVGEKADDSKAGRFREGFKDVVLGYVYHSQCHLR